MSKLLVAFSFILVVSLSHAQKIPAQFEPKNGKVLVFSGQELTAIGGLRHYDDGYFDHFPAPAGFTMYTNFLPGVNSFGHVQKGLDGLTTTDDWGDGPSNMSLQINSPAFRNSCLAIGLDISHGNDHKTASGDYDHLIVRLGKWIMDLEDRPVFLRIGYEFNGHEWNHYQPESYIAAFRRVRDMLDSMGAGNIAYVWQSKGAGTMPEDLEAFYPGDDYVDWCAFSFFTPAEEHHPMISFARRHDKPLMIAEASPVLLNASGAVIPLDLSKPEDAKFAWEQWFIPFFRTIRNHPDVIKAFSYISADWRHRPLWKNNPNFRNLNARIWQNKALARQWTNEITRPNYLNASDSLFYYLGHRNQ